MKFSLLVGSISAVVISQTPGSNLQNYTEMDVGALANVAQEKIKANKDNKIGSSVEDEAFEEVLAEKIVSKMKGKAFYGYWGGVYGLGYPSYNPDFHSAS